MVTLYGGAAIFVPHKRAQRWRTNFQRGNFMKYPIYSIIFSCNIFGIDVLNKFDAKPFNFGGITSIFFIILLNVTTLRDTNSTFITPHVNTKMNLKN